MGYAVQSIRAERRKRMLRQRAVNFFNPDQLKKWNSEMAKAKDFLGQHMA